MAAKDNPKHGDGLDQRPSMANQFISPAKQEGNLFPLHTKMNGVHLNLSLAFATLKIKHNKFTYEIYPK